MQLVIHQGQAHRLVAAARLAVQQVEVMALEALISVSSLCPRRLSRGRTLPRVSKLRAASVQRWCALYQGRVGSELTHCSVMDDGAC
jgi:hypothetical protein